MRTCLIKLLFTPLLICLIVCSVLPIAAIAEPTPWNSIDLNKLADNKVLYLLLPDAITVALHRRNSTLKENTFSETSQFITGVISAYCALQKNEQSLNSAILSLKKAKHELTTAKESFNKGMISAYQLSQAQLNVKNLQLTLDHVTQTLPNTRQHVAKTLSINPKVKIVVPLKTACGCPKITDDEQKNTAAVSKEVAS